MKIGGQQGKGGLVHDGHILHDQVFHPVELHSLYVLQSRRVAGQIRVYGLFLRFGGHSVLLSGGVVVVSASLKGDVFVVALPGRDVAGPAVAEESVAGMGLHKKAAGGVYTPDGGIVVNDESGDESGAVHDQSHLLPLQGPVQHRLQSCRIVGAPPLITSLSSAAKREAR